MRLCSKALNKIRDIRERSQRPCATTLRKRRVSTSPNFYYFFHADTRNARGFAEQRFTSPTYLSTLPSWSKNCLSLLFAAGRSRHAFDDTADRCRSRLAAMYGSSGIGSSGPTTIPLLDKKRLVYGSQPHSRYVLPKTSSSTPLFRSDQCQLRFLRYAFGTRHRLSRHPCT